MRDFLNYYNISRLYILGAGFSAPANLPLAEELLPLVHKTASRQLWYGEGGVPFSKGQAEFLIEELQFYYPTLNFTHDMIELNKIPSSFDFENFLTYVSAESAFIQYTGERWNEHGSKFLALIKVWLGEAIFRRQKLALCGAPDFYYKFCKSLKNALILTFNWDTLLEKLLEKYSIEYTYRPTDIVKGYKVPIVKLHGSIDWFTLPSEISKKDWMNFDPLANEIKEIYKANGDLLRYYKNLMSPWIIVPSFDKISQLQHLGDVWIMPWRFLQNKLEVIIIGYSMRPDDYHSRAFIYPQLVQGSRSGDLKVKIIDYAEDDSQKDSIKARFEGVENIEYFFDGFGEEALAFIES